VHFAVSLLLQQISVVVWLNIATLNKIDEFLLEFDHLVESSLIMRFASRVTYKLLGLDTMTKRELS